MRPSIALDLPDFDPATLTALEDCSEESVYAPGQIQPHGMLLILQEPDLKILQVSQNTEQFLGIPPADLLGKPLRKLISSAQVKQIAELLHSIELQRSSLFQLKVRFKASPTKTQTFRSALYRTAEALILELEPQPLPQKASLSSFSHLLEVALLNLRNATNLTDLAHTLAREIKAITGFDRVMVYRFEADEHGVVIAEAKESHLESYQGLHYPATDIPLPSRKLFYRNWIRQIPNVNYLPAPLVPTHHPLSQTAIDLRDCILRGVHPAHVGYLQNMGVVGSLTLSLIDDQRLWGLIACHHYSPKQVDYETRKICELLSQFASSELVRQQGRELNDYRAQVRTIQAQLQQAFLQEPNFIQQGLLRHAEQLLSLVHAEGVAIILDQQISLVGQTPSQSQVQKLVAWLVQLNQTEIYFTPCLARLYPAARAFKAKASGLLMISIALQQKSYHLVWFRPEQAQIVEWAGDPRTAVKVNLEGENHLTPRKSFQLWKATVLETSLPWETAELEAALMMRNTLMLAVLEFSQAALEQAAERATIANRAKSQFLAKMSHELRTPLNAILGFAQVMNHSSNISSEFQEYLGIISRSGEHLLTLINDVLEMSRIEAGQLTLTEGYFNLQRLLVSLQEMFALKMTQRGLALCFESDRSVPTYVYGDEAKLRQILINLLGNAVKFTSQGGVTLRVRSQLTEKPQLDQADSPPQFSALAVYFEVEDTGCGIDPQHWGSVFEAFMQTEQGRQSQGTGLGLSISRQFARLMGGDITIQSTLGEGSTFTCNLILHQPNLIDLVEPEMAHLVIGLQPGQPVYRILIAEDIAENRQLLRTLLEPIGFEVQEVENGEQAVTQWQQWQPHLIFMDIQMPILNGYEATQKIRDLQKSAIEPSSSNSSSSTKIVALTAYAFEEDRAASLQVGCDGYLSKPFTEASLFTTLADFLNLQYRYAEKSLLEPTKPESGTLKRSDLAIMPAQWIAQVHEAALKLDDEKILQLLTQIPAHQSSLMEGMTDLVYNFQMEAIANLTQPD